MKLVPRKLIRYIKHNSTKVIIGLVICVVSIVFIFQDELRETKIAKTKLEILKTMQTKEMKDWKEGIEHAIDSILIGTDTLSKEIQIPDNQQTKETQ